MRLRVSLVALLLLLTALTISAQVTINRDRAVFTGEVPFTLWGTAPPNSVVTITVDSPGLQPVTTAAGPDGSWSVLWTQPLRTGVYGITVTAGGATSTQDLRVQLEGNVARQPQIVEEPRFAIPRVYDMDENTELTDRWRIVPPPYELDEPPRGRKIGDRGATLDPYNKNLLKGDYPIRGKDTFLVLTGISDTTIESRSLPTPSGPSAARVDSFTFFGDNDQGMVIQNLILTADLYQGLTTFQPVRQRFRVTAIGNYTHLNVAENSVVKPDVRRGTERNDGRLSVQEFFYERKLADLSPYFDFVSVRAGSQQFSSDFRGFVFSDTNLGVRLFGNYGSNRYQYNLAAFERLEKDTNSGLNRNFVFREQQVGVANVYIQDFIRKGYTQSFSITHQRDRPGEKLHFDRNGILVRPAPIGSFTPHDIDATYVGQAGFGHFGRLNVDHALYYVFGKDSHNPIAGPDPELRRGDEIDISAGMAAVELSYDRDWLRPRFALFYASGDSKPRDRTGTGFDSIFDGPAFAGGGFSFFNRLGIRLSQTGVALVDRGSLITSLRSSKDEGQSNFVNPGVQLVSLGLDIEVTLRLKAILTANYIRMDSTAAVEELLFQGDIDNELGADLSVGLRYRPFFTQQWIVVGGIAGFIPGRGFKDIYESDNPLYHVFSNIILQF
ncbi:MAG TPA: hypothetical protein VMS98_20115 [Thermoanaerobaculia bacterium]|nr:hypothetical protein [Thermoanaerobaculia bacterium]